MPAERSWTWRRLLAAFGIFAAVGVLAGGLFVWSGIYPVGADRDHLAITTWLLERVREQSIGTYSSTVEEPPPLDRPDLVRLGAAHFEGGCVPCHARPGEPIGAIVGRMLPPPPDLAAALAERQEPEEVFWIVMNGLKYTGMPAWPAQIRDDEVWALTAFLSRLRSSGPDGMADYAELAGIDRLGRQGDPAPEIGEAEPLTQCRRCHDDAGLPTLGALVPSLAGQSEAYLRRALQEYLKGRRPSGVMQPVADALPDGAIEELAARYASLEPQSPAAETGIDREERARGRQLARHGDPARDVPACLACHGDGRAPSFPSLAGQNAGYLISQLQLWQRGGRISTTHGQIMAPIARRLTPQQMRDAAAYFSSELREPFRGGALSASGRP